MGTKFSKNSDGNSNGNKNGNKNGNGSFKLWLERDKEKEREKQRETEKQRNRRRENERKRQRENKKERKTDNNRLTSYGDTGFKAATAVIKNYILKLKSVYATKKRKVSKLTSTNNNKLHARRGVSLAKTSVYLY